MQTNPPAAAAPETGFVERLLIAGANTSLRLETSSRDAPDRLPDRIERLILADQRKDEFLAVLSHELRGPLAAIQHAVTVLRGAGGKDPTVQGGMHELIARQVRQLSLLATGLLDVGQIARGQVQLQHARIDLVTVLSNAVETVDGDLSRRDQVCTATWPRSSIWIRGDASRLEQVFVNLLTNASKYTDQGGQISLSVQTQDGYAVARVKDTGIGISASALPRIFDIFVQADSASARSRSGVGVGLALVRNFVALHEGSVIAQSAGLGQGSEFVVRLPVQI